MRGIKLTPATRALANATSKNDDRPILSGVKITKREAVAANGFIVIIKAMPAPGMNLEQIGDDGIDEVIIPSDALKACDGCSVGEFMMTNLGRTIRGRG
jgi:predicted acyltransferase